MVDTPEAPDAGAPQADNAVPQKAAQKVELDLDDAPFLQEEETEQPKAPAPAAAETIPELPAPPAPAKSVSLKERLMVHKKKLILAGGALMVLLLSGVGAYFFLSRSSTPPPPKEPPPKTIVVPDKPAPLPVAAAPKYQLAWEPFWVEQKDTEGAIRFLVATFTVPTDSSQLYSEMQAKKVVLRDALFYYLRNRPFTMFSDPEKVSALKRDLMTVINEHVASGKVEDIFIENYLVK